MNFFVNASFQGLNPGPNQFQFLPSSLAVTHEELRNTSAHEKGHQSGQYVAIHRRVDQLNMNGFLCRTNEKENPEVIAIMRN